MVKQLSVHAVKGMDSQLYKELDRVNAIVKRMDALEGEFAGGKSLDVWAEELKEGRAARISFSAKLTTLVKAIEEIKKSVPSNADLKAANLKIGALEERIKKLESRK